MIDLQGNKEYFGMKNFTLGRYVEDDLVFSFLMVEESGQKTVYRAMKDTETGRTYFLPRDPVPQRDTAEIDLLEARNDLDIFLTRAMHVIDNDHFRYGDLDPKNPAVKKNLGLLRALIPTGIYVIAEDASAIPD